MAHKVIMIVHVYSVGWMFRSVSMCLSWDRPEEIKTSFVLVTDVFWWRVHCG